MSSSDYSWNFSDWESALGLAVESLEDNIKGTDEIKLSSRLHKTEEEIERFLVDESFDEIERAIYLLRSGAFVQKCSVLNSLGTLIKECGARVIPDLLDVVTKDSAQFQIQTGKALIQVIEQDLLPLKTAQTIIPVGKKLLQSKQEEVVETWADVMVACIKLLPSDVIENEILPQALLDGGLAQPVPFRIWCCKVMGAAAMRMNGKKVESIYFRRAMALCQDTDYEVRKCMCSQLNNIAKSIGLELSKTELMDEYVELLMDEEAVVREEAVQNILHLLEFLDTDTKTKVIIPQLKKMTEDKTMQIQLALARLLGEFMWKLKDNLTQSDTSHFIAFYQSLANSGNEESRAMCAYNFPAILKVVGPERYEATRLDKIFDTLAADDASQVRRRITSGIHEVATLLGKRSYICLRTAFNRLIVDKDLEVANQIIGNTDAVLHQFVKDEGCRSEARFCDILFLILKRERECARDPSLNWRLHHLLLKQFERFPDYFDTDVLYDHCIPTLFELVTDNVVRPIRKTAVRTICHFLRKMRKMDQRERICRQINDISEANSCHDRLIYLKFCKSTLEIFSHRFFKENFLGGFLDLAKDPVANIRIKVCQMLPDVRKTLRLPADSALLQRLNDVIGTFLTTDTDRDVTFYAHEVAGTLSGMATVFVSALEDAADKAKEEEEDKVVANDLESEDSWRRRENYDADMVKRLLEKSRRLEIRNSTVSKDKDTAKNRLSFTKTKVLPNRFSNATATSTPTSSSTSTGIGATSTLTTGNGKTTRTIPAMTKPQPLSSIPSTSTASTLSSSSSSTSSGSNGNLDSSSQQPSMRRGRSAGTSHKPGMNTNTPTPSSSKTMSNRDHKPINESAVTDAELLNKYAKYLTPQDLLPSSTQSPSSALSNASRKSFSGNDTHHTTTNLKTATSISPSSSLNTSKPLSSNMPNSIMPSLTRLTPIPASQSSTRTGTSTISTSSSSSSALKPSSISASVTGPTPMAVTSSKISTKPTGMRK